MARPVDPAGDEISEQQGHPMDLILELYVKADEPARGQTMTEYALILAAVAVIVVGGYKGMGTTIKSVLSSVDNEL